MKKGSKDLRAIVQPFRVLHFRSCAHLTNKPGNTVMMYHLFYRYRDALPSARQLLLEGEQISTLIEEKWHFDKAFCHNEMNPTNIILTDSNGEFPTRTLLILTSITGISRFRF